MNSLVILIPIIIIIIIVTHLTSSNKNMNPFQISSR